MGPFSVTKHLKALTILVKYEKITIHDVACAAGVSAATVSRSLNLPDQVKPAVRAHVIATAERLGHLADGAARALASRRSGAVGAIVPTLDTPIFATCIAALQQRLDEHGRVLLIASTGYDPAREARDLRGLLERGVDGVMLIGADHAATVWHLLASARVPVVVAWTTTGAPPGVPFIGFDNRAATRRLVSYLVDIGHRRIAMIAGPNPGNDRATAGLPACARGWPARASTGRRNTGSNVPIASPRDVRLSSNSCRYPGHRRRSSAATTISPSAHWRQLLPWEFGFLPNSR
jgi:LacI family transcriptional regulator